MNFQSMKREEIKNAIKGAGFTVQEICFRANMAHSNISTWFNNPNRTVTVATIEKLQKAFDEALEEKNSQTEESNART